MPIKKGTIAPALDAAMEVIRVSMQVIDQPKIEDFATTWLKQIKMPQSKRKA
jgi:hypothetical protein